VNVTYCPSLLKHLSHLSTSGSRGIVRCNNMPVRSFLGAGGVVVRVSDLGSKGPGFDIRAVPKSECMFVSIYHYEVVSYVILCV